MELEFICNDCNHITVYWKQYKEEIPSSVECEQCKSTKTRRVWGIGYISVPAGKCGNSKNGYTSKK